MVLLVVAGRVEVVGRGALDRHDAGAGLGLDRALARAALRAVDALLEQHDAERRGGGDHRHDRDDRQPAAHPQRQPAAGAVGQRAQHGGRLAGRAARAVELARERLLEVGLQAQRVRVALAQVLVRHPVEDRRQARGDLGAALGDVGQVLADVLHRHGDLVLAVEGDVAREHLVEHDAERVDVRLAVDVVAERLLGRDVVRGAEHAALGGQAAVVHRAGDAEVGDLGRALLVDEDVLRLDVAVDDAAPVRGAERAGDLDRVGDRLVDRQAPEPADPVLERLALDVLEDDVGAPVLLARVDHADDVRVRELRDGARLAAEALELVGLGRDVAVHELDRDAALQRGVEGAVDRRHAARAHLGIEPVAAVQQGAHECAHAPVPIVAEDSTSVGPPL